MVLTDPNGRPFTLQGWHSFKLIQADQAHEIKGLEEIAANVRAGNIAPTTPVFVATHVGEGGYKEVRIGVPLEHEEVTAWRRGDRSMAREIAEALEDAYEGFMAQVKSGTLN